MTSPETVAQKCINVTYSCSSCQADIPEQSRHNVELQCRQKCLVRCLLGCNGCCGVKTNRCVLNCHGCAAFAQADVRAERLMEEASESEGMLEWS